MKNIFNKYFKFVENYLFFFLNFRIKCEENPESEYSPENLHDLIIYVYENINLIYSHSERKLLLMSLILFYYQTKGDIHKNSKYILKLLKHIYFDNKLDEEKFKDESPIKP